MSHYLSLIDSFAFLRSILICIHISLKNSFCAQTWRHQVFGDFLFLPWAVTLLEASKPPRKHLFNTLALPLKRSRPAMVLRVLSGRRWQVWSVIRLRKLWASPLAIWDERILLTCVFRIHRLLLQIFSTQPFSASNQIQIFTNFLHRGSKAHLSSKDRSDKQNVLTVGLQTHKGTRVGSVHIHADGTFKFLASRVGREGGYSATIAQANIPGYIAGDNDTLRDGDKGSSSKK